MHKILIFLPAFFSAVTSANAEVFVYQLSMINGGAYDWFYSVGENKLNALCAARNPAEDETMFTYVDFRIPGDPLASPVKHNNLEKAKSCQASSPSWIKDAAVVKRCTEKGWFAIYTWGTAGGSCGHPTRKSALEAALKSCLANGGCSGERLRLTIYSGYDSGKYNPIKKAITKSDGELSLRPYPGKNVKVCLGSQGECADYKNWDTGNANDFRVYENWDSANTRPQFLYE